MVGAGGDAAEGEVDEGGGGVDLDDAGEAADEAVVVRAGGRGGGGVWCWGVEDFEDAYGGAWGGGLVVCFGKRM